METGKDIRVGCNGAGSADEFRMAGKGKPGRGGRGDSRGGSGEMGCVSGDMTGISRGGGESMGGRTGRGESGMTEWGREHQGRKRNESE